jgi:hypothetical protein
VADNDSETLAEFCASVKISRAKYFKMRKEGRGAREMRDGRWVRITPKAKRDWCRQRERERKRAGSSEAAA